jgi:hypothetical protein
MENNEEYNNNVRINNYDISYNIIDTIVNENNIRDGYDDIREINTSNSRRNDILFNLMCDLVYRDVSYNDISNNLLYYRFY